MVNYHVAVAGHLLKPTSISRNRAPGFSSISFHGALSTCHWVQNTNRDFGVSVVHVCWMLACGKFLES
jgi:hypothetical protein